MNYSYCQTPLILLAGMMDDGRRGALRLGDGEAERRGDERWKTENRRGDGRRGFRTAH